MAVVAFFICCRCRHLIIASARSKRSGNRFGLKKIRRDQTLPARHRLNLKRYRLEHDPINMGAAEHKHGPAYGKVERMFSGEVDTTLSKRTGANSRVKTHDPIPLDRIML
jgi:hypothetical protein